MFYFISIAETLNVQTAIITIGTRIDKLPFLFSLGCVSAAGNEGLAIKVGGATCARSLAKGGSLDADLQALDNGDLHVIVSGYADKPVEISDDILKVTDQIGR